MYESHSSGVGAVGETRRCVKEVAVLDREPECLVS
jgi:hypothetical protein